MLYSPLDNYDAQKEAYVISVRGPNDEIGILQSDPDKTLDIELRLVLEFLCEEFAECSGASDRGLRYAARDRCMAGVGSLRLSVAKARDTLEKLEGYINRLVAKHNRKFGFEDTITQSKEGGDLESEDS